MNRSHFWRPEGQSPFLGRNQGVCQVLLPREALGPSPSLPLAASGLLASSGRLYLTFEVVLSPLGEPALSHLQSLPYRIPFALSVKFTGARNQEADLSWGGRHH